MKKNNKIQILRALAIIFVVIIHTTPDGLYQVISRPFTNICVATFIFIFGYLTPIKINDSVAFCRKRIMRVIIPYLLWIFVYTLLFGNFKSIFTYFITSNIAPHFYYILVYIQLVLICPFISNIVNSKFRNAFWYITPVSVIIFKYFPIIFNFSLHPYITLLYENSCLGWFIYYYLGIFLGNHLFQSINKISVNNYVKKILVVYIISLIIQMFEGWIMFVNGIENFGSQIKLSSIFTSIAFVFIEYLYITSEIDIGNNFLLKKIGDCSFGIYLIHMLILNLLNKYFLFYECFPFILNSLFVLMISFFIVLIFQKIFGKKIGKIVGFY